MQPSTPEVVAAVEAVVRADWATASADPVAWLDTLGLAPTEVDPAFPTWGEHIPGWGDTTVCWSRANGGLGGVGWFLWRGLGLDELWRAADELRVALHERYGACHCCETTKTGYRCSWVVDELNVELFASFRKGDDDEREVQVHVTNDPAERVECGDACCADITQPV